MCTKVTGVCGIDSAAQRVAIQQAVARTTDKEAADYGLLSDGERLARLLAAADDIALAAQTHGIPPHARALVALAAEAQLWAEALQAGTAR